METTKFAGVRGMPTQFAFRSASRGSTSKTRQTSRIRELASALAADGLVTLGEQARALGLSRSSAWAVLKANHKASGLAAGTIKQMLSSPALPPRARDDFDLRGREACRSLRPQQNAIAPICSGARPCARAVCRQCSRGYSRLDHRHVGYGVAISYWSSRLASVAPTR